MFGLGRDNEAAEACNADNFIERDGGIAHINQDGLAGDEIEAVVGEGQGLGASGAIR